MDNFLLLYNAFSLLLGLASLVLFASLYYKYRTKLLKLYFIFLCVFTGLVLLSVGIQSFSTIYYGLAAADINVILHTIWYPFLFLFSMIFIHQLTEQPLSKKKLSVLIPLLSLFPLMAAIAFLTMNNTGSRFDLLRKEFFIAGGILIIGLIGYLAYFTLRHYSHLKNEFIKRTIKLGAIMIAVFLLGLLNEAHILPASPEMKSLPTGLYFYLFYYFLWNLIGIVLLISYFMGSLGLAVNMVNEIPEFFVKTLM